MKQKRQESLCGGVLILSLCGMLVKVCGFFYKVPLNALLSDEMANVNAAYAVYTVLYTLSTAGIPTGIAVLLAEARARGEEGGASVVRAARPLLVGVGFAGALLLSLLAYPLARWNSGGDTYFCLLAISPALFFVCLSSVYRGAFQGMRQMTPIAVSEVLEALGKMGLGLLFALLALRRGAGGHAAAALSVLGITLGMAVGAGYLGIRLRRAMPEKGARVAGLRRRLLALSLPIMAASVMLNLSALADAQLMRPLLARFYGDADLAKAVYADYSTGAVTLYNLPTVLIYPITCAMIPTVAQALAGGAEKRAGGAVATAFRMAALVSLPCTLFLGVLGGPCLGVVFRGDGDMVQNAGGLLMLLSPAVFLAAMLTVSSAALQAYRLQKHTIFSVGAGIGVKLVCSLLLTPFLGAAATPLGTVLFFLTAVLLNLGTLCRRTGFSPALGQTFLRPFAAAVFSSGAGFGVYAALHGRLGYNAVLPAGAAALAVFALTALLLRCVGEAELRRLRGGERLCLLLQRLHLLQKTGE